jgi:hypothetical protein
MLQNKSINVCVPTRSRVRAVKITCGVVVSVSPEVLLCSQATNTSQLQHVAQDMAQGP